MNHKGTGSREKDRQKVRKREKYRSLEREGDGRKRRETQKVGKGGRR